MHYYYVWFMKKQKHPILCKKLEDHSLFELFVTRDFWVPIVIINV